MGCGITRRTVLLAGNEPLCRRRRRWCGHPARINRGRLLDGNTTAKRALGAATLWPFVYILVFIGFIFSTFLSMSHDTSDAHARATLPTAFIALFAVHLATMLEIIGLLVFYVVDAFRNPRIPADQRILWAI